MSTIGAIVDATGGWMVLGGIGTFMVFLYRLFLQHNHREDAYIARLNDELDRKDEVINILSKENEKLRNEMNRRD